MIPTVRPYVIKITSDLVVSVDAIVEMHIATVKAESDNDGNEIKPEFTKIVITLLSDSWNISFKSDEHRDAAFKRLQEIKTEIDLLYQSFDIRSPFVYPYNKTFVLNILYPTSLHYDSDDSVLTVKSFDSSGKFKSNTWTEVTQAQGTEAINNFTDSVMKRTEAIKSVAF